MPNSFGTRLNAALDYAQGHEDELRAHFEWSIEKMTDDIGLNDLTMEELVGLAALLIPAHTRFLTGRGAGDDAATAAGKLLSLIRDPAV